MHEALLAEKISDSRVQCNICQWHCKIGVDRFGVCGMYQNKNGTLYDINYALVSSAAVDPIEKKPLFHFYPGSLVFSMGTLGCNFHCKHCQNWEISTADNKLINHSCREIQPAAAVDMAINSGCMGIAWTYNEPSIWFGYTLDTAKSAKQKNLYTVYVTNGYLSPEALDIIGPYMDAWRVDIKGFSDSLYKELSGIPRWREILEVAIRAKNKWNMHVEVVTNIIPTINDDEQLEGIAGWIHDELGELTPWHVTRFYPNYHMTQLQPTPISTLEHACEIGKKAGLKFIYTGNIPGHKSENTICYSCGNTVVERAGYSTDIIGLDNSKCRYCGTELNFRMAS